MVRPISLRLRNAEILAKARATLIRAGRGPELERQHAAAELRRARATVERRREQDRLRRVAVLAAQKAILAVNRTFRAQDQLDANDAERARWNAARALMNAWVRRHLEIEREQMLRGIAEATMTLIHRERCRSGLADVAIDLALTQPVFPLDE